jgi:hypothetical protein
VSALRIKSVSSGDMVRPRRTLPPSAWPAGTRARDPAYARIIAAHFDCGAYDLGGTPSVLAATNDTLVLTRDWIAGLMASRRSDCPATPPSSAAPPHSHPRSPT